MKKKRIIIIMLIICLIINVFSTTKIIIWYLDSKKTNQVIKDIQSNVSFSESQNTSQIISMGKYNKESFLSVDFLPLRNINDEIKGWIQLKGTNINYPFVQHKDNSYYLSHSLDKSKNEAGWLFVDYRNHMDTLDMNTIIYAHGRVDGTMLGSLKKTLQQEWLEDDHNYVVKMSTPSYNYIFEVFSIYHIKTTNDYLITNFEEEEAYQSFLQKLKQRSIHNFEVNISPQDKIITFSTCYNSREKMVLHAKLVKQMKRIEKSP